MVCIVAASEFEQSVEEGTWARGVESVESVDSVESMKSWRPWVGWLR
jgi:hypothetical protein